MYSKLSLAIQVDLMIVNTGDGMDGENVKIQVLYSYIKFQKNTILELRHFWTFTYKWSITATYVTANTSLRVNVPMYKHSTAVVRASTKKYE